MTRLTAFWVLFATCSYAQERSSDVWLSAGSTYGFTKDLSFSLEEGIRFSNGFTDQTYTDLSLGYDVNKYLDVAATWRNAYEGGFWDAGEIRNRFLVDVKGEYELDPLQFSLRLRHQIQYTDIYTSEKGYLPENVFRFRFSLRYSLDKETDIEGGLEPYVGFHRSGNYIDRYRLQIGLRREIADYHKFELTYIFQSEVQVKNPSKTDVVSLSYSFDFMKFRDDKREAREAAKPDKINWYILPK